MKLPPPALSEAHTSAPLTLSPYTATQVKGKEHFPRGSRQHRQPSSLSKTKKKTLTSTFWRSPPKKPRGVGTHLNDQLTNSTSVCYPTKACGKSSTSPRQELSTVSSMRCSLRTTLGTCSLRWAAQLSQLHSGTESVQVKAEGQQG